jgi:hypothetical protein
MGDNNSESWTYVRLPFTALLWGVGLLFSLKQHARFTFGGSDERPGLPVDASGFDAIAIGCVFIALGILNLAIAIPRSKATAVFWVGAGLFLASVAYGIVRATLAVATLFE